MRSFIILFVLLTAISCKQNPLPILGHREVVNGDTLYSEIPEFELRNQDSALISLNTIKGKIHLACFFFTSCPTICPKVMRSMVKLEQEFKRENSLAYLCFSIDPKRDLPSRLKQYQNKLGIHNPNFHFLSMPNSAVVKQISEKYMSTALEDPFSPGGFDHSGWILLVDQNLHLRSYAAGTDDAEVDRLIVDIKTLLNE